MRYKQIVILLAGIIFWTSCKEESKLDTKILEGKWNFERAYRNGRETKTMSSAFFNFKDDLVFSNIFTTEDGVPFDITPEKLTISGNENFKFKIVEMGEELIKLRGKKDDFNLEIHLSRNSENVDSLFRAAKELNVIESANEIQ